MKYSLIIPHRGSERLLSRLLASVPQRGDMEVVVVRDEAGHGAGWARNRGLEQARGEYVIFADSDDEFLPAFTQVLDADLTADITFFNADSVDDDTNRPSWRARRLNAIMAKSGAERERLLRCAFTEPWCHVIKRALIDRHSLRFDTTPIVNDVTFITRAGYYAESVAVVPVVAYRVRNRRRSTAKQVSDRRLLTTASVMARANAFNRQHHVPYYHARMLRPFMQCLTTGRWRMARRCWHTMLDAGITPAWLACCVARYPADLTKAIWRRTR